MKLIQAEAKENLRLYAGILLLVALSFYAFWLRPVTEELTASRTQYESLRREIVTGKAKARELLGYAQRVSGLKKEVLTLEQRLRAGNQVLLFFKDAEQGTRHAGVELGGITPGAPVVENDVTKQPISINVSGSLHSILHFVNYLEQLTYPVRVTKLDIKSGGATGDNGASPGGAAVARPGDLTASVQVEMYSLGNGTDAATTGAAGEGSAGKKAGESQ